MYDDPVCRQLGECKWDVPVAAIQCCMMYTPGKQVEKKIDEAVREIKREVQQLKLNIPDEDKPKETRLVHDDTLPKPARRRSRRRRGNFVQTNDK